MNLKQISPDVFLAASPIAVIGASEIRAVTEALETSTKGRVRINMHQSSDDPLHEMLIAIRPGSYVRPHKHPAKSESFHIVHGATDVVIFDDAGEITEIVLLAANDPERAFYYRMSTPLFHTVIVRSEVLVVHEITNGPFRRDGTVFADFAPADDDPAMVNEYSQRLEARIAAWRGE